ncbi:MAG: helix-turn-helix domain-containing protein [Leptospiraceae bacterium]|nr:helix-turn-helix domain-containing protein [Leptospiraceae bacterium]
MRIFFLIFSLFFFHSCSEDHVSFFSTSQASHEFPVLEELNVNASIESCEEIASWDSSPLWVQTRSEGVIRLDSNQNDKWLRFHFKNSSGAEREWYFILKWTLLDFAEFCSPLHESRFETQLSGIQVPYSDWPIHSFFPSFRFWLEPDEEEVFYLRVKSYSPVAVPVKALPLNDFLKEIRKIAGINFLFFGFGVFYILFNIFQFYESKDSIYIYNSVFVLFLTLTVLSRFGIAYELFWNHSPVWQSKSIHIFLGITVFGALEFTKRILNIKKYFKRSYLIFVILGYLGLFYSLLALFPIPRLILSQSFAVYFFLMLLIILITALRVYFEKKYHPAKWFLAAISLFFIISILNFIFHLDLWDYNRFWIYAFMFFLPVSFVLNSISLADRVKQIKLESEKYKSEIQILLEKLKTYTEEKPKYARSQLAGLDVQKVVIKLIDLMENDKIYYDETLSMEGLSSQLHLTRHQLSEILNRILGTNFYDFVQKYRIREAMEMIEKRKDLNILNIAFEVGFQSKSAFNTAFKKISGTTPIGYKSSLENPEHSRTEAG